MLVPSAASVIESGAGVHARGDRMGEPLAFWLDPRADPTRRPQDGAYAEVLHRHLADFDGIWGDIAPVAFACSAWRLAIPPIADPGFIRCHQRVLTARCEQNAWDGSLTTRLILACPLPSALTVSKAWWHDRGWQEWPQIFGQYVEPAQKDLAKHPFIRPALYPERSVSSKSATSWRRNLSGAGEKNFSASSSRETLAMIRFGTQIVPSALRWMPWSR